MLYFFLSCVEGEPRRLECWCFILTVNIREKTYDEGSIGTYNRDSVFYSFIIYIIYNSIVLQTLIWTTKILEQCYYKADFAFKVK